MIGKKEIRTRLVEAYLGSPQIYHVINTTNPAEYLDPLFDWIEDLGPAEDEAPEDEDREQGQSK